MIPSYIDIYVVSGYNKKDVVKTITYCGEISNFSIITKNLFHNLEGCTCGLLSFHSRKLKANVVTSAHPY